MKKIRVLLIACSVLFVLSCHSVRCEYFSDLWTVFEDEEELTETSVGWADRCARFVDILKTLDNKEDQKYRKDAIVEIVTHAWRKRWSVDFIEHLVRQLDDKMLFSNFENWEKENIRCFWAVLGRISDRYFGRPIECERESLGLPGKVERGKMKAGLNIGKRKKKKNT